MLLWDLCFCEREQVKVSVNEFLPATFGQRFRAERQAGFIFKLLSTLVNNLILLIIKDTLIK